MQKSKPTLQDLENRRRTLQALKALLPEARMKVEVALEQIPRFCFRVRRGVLCRSGS